MARALFYFLMGGLFFIGVALNISQDSSSVLDKAIADFPDARFLSKVDVPGGASAIFLCKDGELTVVVADRLFRSRVIHNNDMFSCK